MITKKEVLVWKIIKDCRGSFYLVEASLPKGTNKVHIDSKVRVNQAKINHITKINGNRWDFEDALFGNVPKEFTIVEDKVKNKVTHYPRSGDAKVTTYKVGEMLEPHKFNPKDCSCSPGLHFFLSKDFPKKVKWA